MGLFSSSYDYGGKRKRTFIVILIILLSSLLIVSFVIGWDYKTKSLREEVSSLQSGLKSLESSLDEKNSEIVEKQKDILTYENKLSLSSGELNVSQEEIQNLNNEIIMLKQALGNAVVAVCCSFDDVQQGVEKTWQMLNGTVVCSGSLKVNCIRGVSDDLN